VNRYEAVILDKMVEIWNEGRTAGTTRQQMAMDNLIVLLDCICDFREPPRALDVADGYGALVDGSGEVIA
jgi:hypothetical protein